MINKFFTTAVNSKGNQPWAFIGRTDVEAPILWPPDVKSWLIGKDPDAEKDWKQKEKGVAEDEMVGWHHWFNGHEFEQTPGDNEGQEAWRAAVHAVGKSQTQLRAWTTTATVGCVYIEILSFYCYCCSVTQLCPTLWPHDCSMPAFLFFSISWSFLKLMSIESVMPSNNLILCCPLLFMPSVFPSIKVYYNESAPRSRWPKYRSFCFNISLSNEYSGLIS